MKRPSTTSLPVSSQEKKKKKTSKDKKQEPKNEGKRQMLIEEWLTKTCPIRRIRVTFSTDVTERHLTRKGMLSVTSKVKCLVEEEDNVQRQSLFKTRRQRDKENMRLRHEVRKQNTTPRRLRIRSHVLNTIRRVNSLNL